MANNKRTRHTFYDDAFRTIEQECDDALIYFVNRMFNEHYKRDAKVERLRNEHYDQDDEKQKEKSITDARFSITEGKKKRYYHLECESSGYGEVVLIRMFRYGISHARINGDKKLPYKFTVTLPKSGILFLRDKGDPPDHLTFEMITPNGRMSYDTPVIRLSDYSLDRIFRQKMYFLLPFYFVSLEARIKYYNNSEEDLREFEAILKNIIDRLGAVDEAELSLRTKGVIMKETENVIKGLAINDINVIERVGDIMGGKPHKIPWLEKYDADIAEATKKGEAMGEAERKKLKAEIDRLRKENEELKKLVTA